MARKPPDAKDCNNSAATKYYVVLAIAAATLAAGAALVNMERPAADSLPPSSTQQLRHAIQEESEKTSSSSAPPKATVIESSSIPPKESRPGWQALVSAAHKGDVHGVREQLALGAVNELVQLGQVSASALHVAASQGHAEVVETLVVRGASCSVRDHERSTPLHVAARHGHASAVAALLEHCTDDGLMQAGDSHGATALHRSAAIGSSDVVDVLLAHGADVTATDAHGLTAEAAAAQGGHELVRALLLQVGCSDKASKAACEARAAADDGEGCYTDPAMKDECALTCGTCGLLSKPECARDAHAVPAATPGSLEALFTRIAAGRYANGESASSGALASGALPHLNVTVHSFAPWVITIDGFMSGAEADDILTAGRRSHSFERSTTHLGGERSKSIRTSSTLWCNAPECFDDPTVDAISRRVEALTGVPLAYTEYLQLLKYDAGEAYGVHHDQGIPRASPWGSRQYTFFMYLSDEFTGGATRFPELDDLTIGSRHGRDAPSSGRACSMPIRTRATSACCMRRCPSRAAPSMPPTTGYTSTPTVVRTCGGCTAPASATRENWR